jgi:hypothetical protein
MIKKGLLSFVFLSFSQQLLATGYAQSIEPTMIQHGRPMMINTVNFADRNKVLNHNNIVELTVINRLQLIPGTVVRRIEVRAAGQGQMVVMINDRPASKVIDLVGHMNEFKTYTLEINTTLPHDQRALSVRLEFGASGSSEKPTLPQIRVADITTISVDNKPSSRMDAGHQAPLSDDKCSLSLAVSSYGWVVRSKQGDVPFSSPVKLFNHIQQNCQPMQFRCEVGALATRPDGTSAFFGIFVEVRGDWLLATGAYSKRDADEKANELRKTGFCNY